METSIMSDLGFILLAPISLFVVVGPLSTASLFLAMTPNKRPD